MVYGTILKYPYTELDEDGNEVEKVLNLKFNLTTLEKYYDYVGSDLMADMSKLSRNLKKATNIADMSEDELIEYIGDMTDEDYEAMFGNSYSIKFYGNLVAAMICSYYRDKNLVFEEVKDSIPLGLLQDQTFIDKLMALLSFGIKKN